MKLQRPYLEQRLAACPRCRDPAIYICIRFHTGARWIVDAGCAVCGYDIGKRIVAHYPLSRPIEGERPLMNVDPFGICPNGVCLSVAFVIKRGYNLIAAACSNQECGHYVLPSGVAEAYADYLQLVSYGIGPFGDNPNANPRETTPLDYEEIEINVDDSQFPTSL